MILIVAPSPSVDVTYLLDRFEPHTIHRPRQVVRVPGGKALNAARVAAALGASVRVVTALGGPTGAWIDAELRRRGIAVHAVPAALATRSCVSIAHDGGLTEVYEPATPVSAVEWAALVEAAADATADATGDAPAGGWTVVSGSLPAGPGPDGAGELVAAARAAGRQVCVDTAGPALAAALAAGPDLVKVNAEEAAELLGAPPGTSIVDLARGLRERAGGTGAAVVTAGVRGAAAWSGGGSGGPAGPVVVDPPATRGAYPVGSGDAFLAGLVVALAAGADLPAGLRAAAAAAAANAAVAGAGELPAGHPAVSLSAR